MLTSFNYIGIARCLGSTKEETSLTRRNKKNYRNEVFKLINNPNLQKKKEILAKDFKINCSLTIWDKNI